MTTTPDTATTWRDLQDELTPDEVAKLEEREIGLREYLKDHADSEIRVGNVLIEVARNCIEQRAADAAYADVPLPAGASTDSEGWGKNLQREGHSRALVWRSYEGGLADLRLAGTGISVDIDGRQQCDGSFTRGISLWGVDEGGELTAEVARGLAAVLAGAADELDRLDRLDKATR